ncbi:MAG: hypothetical protein D6681_12295, partial [Calditrichaeota bacterium]
MMERIKRNWRYIFTLLVICSDFLLFNLAYFLALYLRFNEVYDPFWIRDYWKPFLFLDLAFFPLALGLGVYRGIFKCSLENQKIHLKKFTYYLALFTLSALFLLKGNYSRGMAIIFLMTQYFLLEINHSLLSRLNRALFRKGFGNKRVLIVGTDHSALRFSEHLQDIYGEYYSIKGFIANGTPQRHDPLIIPHIVGKYEDVEELIPAAGIDQVFIVSDSMRQHKYEPIRKACEKHGVKVKMVAPDIRNLMHQIKVKDVTGVPLTTYTERGRFSSSQARLKRLFDLTVVLLTSVIWVPLCLVIAALV